MKLLVTALILAVFSSCQPIGGADPLDSAGSAGSAFPVIRTDSQEKTESSFRGEIGMEASADL